MLSSSCFALGKDKSGDGGKKIHVLLFKESAEAIAHYRQIASFDVPVNSSIHTILNLIEFTHNSPFLRCVKNRSMPSVALKV